MKKYSLEKIIIWLLTFLSGVLLLSFLSTLDNSHFKAQQYKNFYGDGAYQEYYHDDAQFIFSKIGQIDYNSVSIVVEYSQNLLETPEADVVVVFDASMNNELFKYDVLSGERFDADRSTLDILVGKNIANTSVKETECMLAEQKCEIVGVLGEKGVKGLFDNVYLLNGFELPYNYFKQVPKGKGVQIKVFSNNLDELNEVTTFLSLKKLNSDFYKTDKDLYNTKELSYLKVVFLFFEEIGYLYIAIILSLFTLLTYVIQNDIHKYYIIKLFNGKKRYIYLDIIKKYYSIFIFSLISIIILQYFMITSNINLIGKTQVFSYLILIMYHFFLFFILIFPIAISIQKKQFK